MVRFLFSCSVDGDGILGKPLIIAGVGSRTAPKSIGKRCVELGAYIAELGGFVRSGHSGMCDLSWEKGAGEKSISYIPCSTFGANNPFHGHVVDFSKIPKNKKKEAYESVERLHPNASHLDSQAMDLLARNWLVVKGVSENSIADLVICYGHRKNGKIMGGTGHVQRIARELGVPLVNMLDEENDVIAAMIEGVICINEGRFVDHMFF